MASKRKTLPADFEQQLKTASLDELIAVFQRCRLDARGGYTKHTAIGFLDCPDALIQWLVAQGLDVDEGDLDGRTPFAERAAFGRVAQMPLLISLGADIERRDDDGATPLHAAAGHHQPEAVRLLLAEGVEVDVLDDEDRTPLEYGLIRTSNIDITEMAEVAGLLLEAGAAVSDAMREEVERIGSTFEFHRAGFNPDTVEETAAGLARLCALFGVEVPGERRMHDGVSPIRVPAGDWRDQHQALWTLLVPSMGAAQTVQGEVIRVSGRIAIEIHDTGGANWDRDYRRMLAAFPAWLAMGHALPDDALAQARTLAEDLRDGAGDLEEVERLLELAVAWVALNPSPRALGPVTWKR